MIYSEVIEYLYGQLPMFHRIGKIAYKNNLDNALHLDKLCNFPHRKYKTIHVAGTNGKGSVSHMLASVLQSAGYKTGLFTSPHLKDFRERIKVNGEMVAEADVILFVEEFRPVFDKIQPSFFEMTSAFAFKHFADKQVDIAIIEVGMGGRLDSTNIIMPILSVITNIGLDHVEYLGDTLAKIAMEKAGIIKEKIPVVIGEFHPETYPIFEQVAQNKHSELIVADRVFKVEKSNDKYDVFQDNKQIYSSIQLDLKGFYQQKNSCTVLSAIEILRKCKIEISKETIIVGLEKTAKQTGLMGRWQTIGTNPTIVCDTGHNKDGIRWVVEQLKQQTYRKLHIVIGMVSDKDILSVLKLLPKEAIYYFTNATIPRALPAAELQQIGHSLSLHGNCYSSVQIALESAKEQSLPNDFIFVGGSTFVVAEVVSSFC